MQALKSQVFFLVETRCKLNHTFYVLFQLWIQIFCFWCLLLIFGSAADSVAFHHVIPAPCDDIQHSAPLLNHPGSITNETPVPRTALHCTISRALSFCFRYLWVWVFFALFNICLPYLLLLKILFGVLLLSITRQPINMDQTVGLPRFLKEKPCHTSVPSLAWNLTSLLEHFFIYLNEKFHLENRRHNKGPREENEGDEKPGGRERIN